MSRLPSFFTVSSGNAQLLQNVLIPRACNSSRNNQTFWNARADLSNIGTIYAETVVSSNFSGGTAGINTDEAKGTTYLGAGSSNGTFPTGLESNIAAFGTKVLGGYGESTFIHGPVSNVVAVGATALEGASNIRDSVFVGTLAGQTASNVSNVVAIGNEAGQQTRGSNNVYIGTRSGTVGTGSGNVFIGSLVGSSDVTTSNTLYIGNQSGSYLLQGNFSNGTLGLNINPTTNFDVSGTTRLRGTTTITASLGVNTTSPTTTLDVSGTSTFRGTTTITASLGVNTTSPTTTLDVSGTSTFRGVTIVNSNFGVNIAPESTLDVSGITRLRGNVIIDGDLTVSGGPIGSDVCTGQVILGIGASLSTYPSLIAVRGGLQVSEGYIQINRTEFPFQYPLDVSGNARITGSNLIGSVTLCGSGVFTSGTISGVFSNASNTSNSIGGITLSAGQLGMFNSTLSRTVFFNGDTSNGGRLILRNDLGQNTFSVFGSTNLSASVLEMADSNGTPTLTICGSSGRISNLPTSSNSIGGITLSTGRLSGTGFAFDVSGTNAPRLALRDLTNGAAGVEMFANDYTTGGGTLNLRSQGADGIPQVQIRSSGTRGNGGGQITLTNQFSTLSTCVIYGDTGDIINSVTSSNSIGGITLSSGFLYGLNLNTARSLLNYIVLGVVYDSASNHLYNIYYTGSNGYIDIINSNKCYTLVSAPRTKFQFYSGLGATGSSTVEITSSSFTSESSLNFNSLSPSFESNDRSYRAYFF